MSKSRTTLYIDDELLKQAKVQAAVQDTSVTALVEKGLKKVVKSEIEKKYRGEANISGPTASAVDNSQLNG